MSVDLLRTRLAEDLTRVVSEAAEILASQRQAPLDELRYQQGRIAGLREANELLVERARNLHAIG
jgi:hypothetical protein